MLEVKGLTKRYGRKHALDDIHFNIKKNCINGFLGPNGAGKSTTIKILLGLLKANAGDILIAGAAIETRQLTKGNIRIGAVLEYPAFYPHLSAYANLALLQRLNGQSKDGQSILRALQQVGLQSAAHERFKTFSMGMKQKLALAAAFLADPELLILDEPFNGLDPNAMEWLKGLLRDYIGGGGTVFISSHILSEMEDICQELVILSSGRVVWQGALTDLTAIGSLKEMYLRYAHEESC